MDDGKAAAREGGVVGTNLVLGMAGEGVFARYINKPAPSSPVAPGRPETAIIRRGGVRGGLEWNVGWNFGDLGEELAES